MKMRIRMGTLALFGLAALVGSVRADEVKIALDKVPAAVMKAVKAKFPTAEITQAEKEVEDGKTTYEIGLKADGRNVDVVLKEDGTIEAVEKEIAVKDLPTAVSAAVKAKYPKGTLKKAEEILKGEKKTYEVIVTVGDKKREMVLEPAGKILEDEDDNDD